jgi:hypothetical protein
LPTREDPESKAAFAGARYSRGRKNRTAIFFFWGMAARRGYVEGISWIPLLLPPKIPRIANSKNPRKVLRETPIYRQPNHPITADQK